MKTSPAAIGGLAAGPLLFAACCLVTFVDMQAPLLPEEAVLWTSLLGLLAVIAMTWRFSSAPLALVAILAFGIAAVWHAATWRPGESAIDPSPVDAVLDLGGHLWFDGDHGLPGWVLDLALSSLLPVFVLGAMLASRTCLGSTLRPAQLRGFPLGSLLPALHAVIRFLIPTLVISSLFMLMLLDVDLRMIAAAWLISVGIGLIWFWIRPVIEQELAVTGRAPKASGKHDALLMGVTLATLLASMMGGLSFQLSAFITLGALIALSFLDADIRRRPDVIVLDLARSGVAFGRLLIAAAAVGLILAILDRTGLPIDVARLLAGVAGEMKLPLLVLSALAVIAMALVMPGFAAYLIVAALMGPALRTVGITTPNVHLFVLVVAALTVAIGRRARSATARPLDGERR